MALTDYDKKNLTQSQQKEVEAATKEWNDANARGDKAGMAAASQKAQAVRNSAGYTSDSSGNYSGMYSPLYSGDKTSGSIQSGAAKLTPANSPTVSSGGSSYTPLGTYNDASLSEADKNAIKYYQQQYTDAIARGDKTAAQAAHSAAESIRQGYGYSGGVDGSDYIGLEKAIFQFDQAKPTYNGKYDAQMETLLKQILNRDDFSYDVANDPLYQQYAQMYRREGDRAMANTLAEAAASAGGMNTYAITAAQQANSYYNSQLNDKIPELYKLAYEMYLNDKESMVQDLGLLQGMDATQYGRYRDTMSDYYNDKNFAYGMYRDDIADSQWLKNYNYNAYVDNRNFDYQDKVFDANQEQLAIDNAYRDEVFDWEKDTWTKEFDNTVTQQGIDNAYRDKTFNVSQAETNASKAEKQMLAMIETGDMPDDSLIEAAGWNKSVVEALVAQAKADLISSKKTSSSTGSNPKGDPKSPIEPESSVKTNIGLQIGPISDEALLELVERNLVILNEDGSMEWAEGVNANNYKEKLNQSKTLLPYLSVKI